MSDLYKQLHASNAMAGGYLTFTADRVGSLPYVPYDPDNKAMTEIMENSTELVSLLPLEQKLNRDLLRFLVTSYGLKPSRDMSRQILAVEFDLVKARLPRSLAVKTVKEISDMFQEYKLQFDGLRAKTGRARAKIEELVTEIYTVPLP
jgi:hypothetical protein